MEKDYDKIFWDSYSENHFWRLNDKNKVKEHSNCYNDIYDTLMPENKSAKILDVGCGGGHFLAYLMRNGFVNIEGVDLASGLVEFVKKEICRNVFNVDAIEFLKERKNVYDLIVANDLVEHLQKKQIIAFLCHCRESIKEDGKIIIKTPNMCNLFASRNRYVDFTHEVGFTEHSLYEVCSAAGFSDVKIYSEYHAASEPFFYKIVRLMYLWGRQRVPMVLSTNIIAVCGK